MSCLGCFIKPIRSNRADHDTVTRGDARLPQATGHDVRVIVFCSEGYTSSLAAAALHDLGLTRATDFVGGFKAWRDAGLPATAGSDSAG